MKQQWSTKNYIDDINDKIFNLLISYKLVTVARALHLRPLPTRGCISRQQHAHRIHVLWSCLYKSACSLTARLVFSMFLNRTVVAENFAGKAKICVKE